MSIPDMYDQWEAHDREKERRLAQRPKCRICGEHTQQERAVFIFGDYICDDCLEDNRVDIDD